MRKVLTNDSRVQIHGPVQATALHASVLDHIHQFRSRIYQETAPYLTQADQNEIEERLQIDERSLHFYATYESKLAGTLRVTGHPFELAELTPELQSASARFDRFLELGRLIVDPHLQKGGIGKKILYSAMLWAYAREHLGFVAICRELRRKEFERFGMTPFEKRVFQIPARNGDYRFMWATWPMIISGMARHYSKKRISKSLNRIKERPWKALSGSNNLATK